MAARGPLRAWYGRGVFKTRWFRMLVTIAASGAVIWFASRQKPRSLLQPVDVPRPVVAPELGTSALPFASANDPFPQTGDALRKIHNAIVQDLEVAVHDYEQGQGSIRLAEQIEMRLIVVRHQLGVMDTQAFHTHMALLFEREKQRIEALLKMKKPQASEPEFAQAALYVERERFLAGDADNDYAAQRDALVVYFQNRVEYLQRQRSRKLVGLQDELLEVQREFPAP